jgi:hypothetical protein
MLFRVGIVLSISIGFLGTTSLGFSVIIFLLNTRLIFSPSMSHLRIDFDCFIKA